MIVLTAVIRGRCQQQRILKQNLQLEIHQKFKLASFIRSIVRKAPKFFPEALSNQTFSWSHNPTLAGRLSSRADEMTSTPQNKSEKSYLSAAVESISPWSTPRTATPTLKDASGSEGSGLKNQKGGDHSSHRYGVPAKSYPKDCPPLNARWFYAVDVG